MEPIQYELHTAKSFIYIGDAVGHDFEFMTEGR